MSAVGGAIGAVGSAIGGAIGSVLSAREGRKAQKEIRKAAVGQAAIMAQAQTQIAAETRQTIVQTAPLVLGALALVGLVIVLRPK